MTNRRQTIDRRSFIKTAAIAGAGPLIVPRYVLGGAGHVAPSDKFGGALIGCGGRGKGTYSDMCRGLNVSCSPSAT